MDFDVLCSLFLGIIVALCIFRLFYTKQNYRGPNSKNIKTRVFTSDEKNKCYMFEPKIYLCPL